MDPRPPKRGVALTFHSESEQGLAGRETWKFSIYIEKRK